MNTRLIKHKISITGIVVLVFFAAACAIAPPAKTAEEQQAEARLLAQAQAQELFLGVEVAKNLEQGEDQWFKFQATETETLVVFTFNNRGTNDYTDTFLRAFTSDNQQIAYDNDSHGLRNARLVIEADADSTYFFWVHGGRFGESGPYSIVVMREVDAPPTIDQAARLEREAANQYDPANFIIVPQSFFYPSTFQQADLFQAIARSERLDVVPSSSAGGIASFVSDLIFVSQNVTDITFRSDDGISRTMKVTERTGLTAGQRVRVYYKVYRLQTWEVVAIERL